MSLHEPLSSRKSERLNHSRQSVAVDEPPRILQGLRINRAALPELVGPDPVTVERAYTVRRKFCIAWEAHLPEVERFLCSHGVRDEASYRRNQRAYLVDVLRRADARWWAERAGLCPTSDVWLREVDQR